MHHKHRLAARHAAICLLACGWFACAPLDAQEVTRVYPRYVIAGQEAHFTIEGRRLPSENSATSGMRSSFANPADCSNARRDKPSSSTRYYFACRFKPGAEVERTRLNISHQLKPKGRVKTRPKPGANVRLWEGVLQVLPAAPQIDSLTVVGELDAGRTSVHCQTSRICTTVVGELRPGKPALIELTGSNLPFTLQLRFTACKSGAAPVDLKNTTTRSFTCLPQTEGEQTLHILSARPDEGGQELYSGRVAVGPTASMPVAQ